MKIHNKNNKLCNDTYIYLFIFNFFLEILISLTSSQNTCLTRKREIQILIK